MKGKRSLRTVIVLVTSILLVSVVASGVMAGPPQKNGQDDSLSSGPVEISLDVGFEEPVSENLFDDRFPSVRQRPVKPDPAFESPEDIVEGSTLELNLFEDTSYTVNIHTHKTDINDVTRIRGDIEGYDHAFVVLSIRDGEVSGTIEIPEKNERFVVQNDPSSRSHYVSEVDLEKLDSESSQVEEKIPEEKERYNFDLHNIVSEKKKLCILPYEVGREYDFEEGNSPIGESRVIQDDGGAPAAPIALEHLICLDIDNFLSVGTAGALQEFLEIGDVVVCEDAL